MGRCVSAFREYERMTEHISNDPWATTLCNMSRLELNRWLVSWRYGDENQMWMLSEWGFWEDSEEGWVASDDERTAWLIRNECGDEAVIHFLVRNTLRTSDINEWGSSNFIKRYTRVARSGYLSARFISGWLPDLDAAALRRVMLYVSRWRKHREQEVADERAAKCAGWEAAWSVAPRWSDRRMDRLERRNKHNARLNKTNALAKIDRIVAAAKKASLAMHPDHLLSAHG